MPERSKPALALRGLERRRFLKLLAAASAAALAAATASAAPPRRAKAKKPVGPARPAALQAEIQNQKRIFAQTLATLRDFPLETGSEPGFTFAPLEQPAANAGKTTTGR